MRIPERKVSMVLTTPWGQAVGNYRLYPQDKSGHFLGVVEFLASDDTAAQEIAERTSAGQPAELWDGPRLVTRIHESAQ